MNRRPRIAIAIGVVMALLALPAEAEDDGLFIRQFKQVTIKLKRQSDSTICRLQVSDLRHDGGVAPGRIECPGKRQSGKVQQDFEIRVPILGIDAQNEKLIVEFDDTKYWIWIPGQVETNIPTSVFITATCPGVTAGVILISGNGLTSCPSSES